MKKIREIIDTLYMYGSVKLSVNDDDSMENAMYIGLNEKGMIIEYSGVELYHQGNIKGGHLLSGHEDVDQIVFNLCWLMTNSILNIYQDFTISKGVSDDFVIKAISKSDIEDKIISKLNKATALSDEDYISLFNSNDEDFRMTLYNILINNSQKSTTTQDLSLKNLYSRIEFILAAIQNYEPQSPIKRKN